MHEYVQKSTRTTFPCSFCVVSGFELIQSEMPVKFGAFGPEATWREARQRWPRCLRA